MKAKGGKDMGRTGNIRMLPGKLIIFFCIFLSFLLAGGTIAEARVYTANCAPSFTSQPGNVVVMAGGNNAIVFSGKGNMPSVGAKNYPWYDLITDYRQYGNSGLSYE